MNSIDEFMVELADQGKSEGTLKTYRYIMETFCYWLDENGGSLPLLTRFDVQLYIKNLDNSGKKAATINKIFACLSTFSRFRNIPHITEGVRIPQVHPAKNIAPKSLERNERNKLLREVERSRSLRDIAIIYLLLHTGLRVSELVALNRGDLVIGDRSGSLIVRSGKGSIERKVPLSKEARFHLHHYLQGRKDEDTALFRSNFQKRISIRAVQHMMSKFNVHPHLLRHTFCRELAGAGVDLSSIADLAGHSDINITRRYTKPTADDLEQVINRVFL